MPENKGYGKRKPLTKRVIIFSFLLGILYTFVGIYLSYKVGIVALGDIFLLGYVLMVREALVRGVLPAMYGLRFLLLGVAAAIVFSYIQSRMKIGAFSPITLAIGMLIPPTYVFPMFLGAALDVYLSRKYGRDEQKYGEERQKWTVINSGLFAEEGAILMIFTFASLLPLIFGS